jgi:aspartate carbamoyltransferase regulatory subunit
MNESKDIKERVVSAIREGMVIDHIPSEVTFKIVDMLKLHNHPTRVLVGTHLTSKKQGEKAIIKIEGKFLTEHEVSKIAILAPHATVSTIRNFSVQEKRAVRLPEHIKNSIKCSNPACITNHERVNIHFRIVSKHPLQVQCPYCERSMGREDIKLE